MKKIIILVALVLAAIVFAASRLVSQDGGRTAISETPAVAQDSATGFETPPSIAGKTPQAQDLSESEDESDELPVFEVRTEAQALAMLSELGIDNDQFQKQLTAWGLEHGVSIGWMIPVEDMLDQPYNQYDDETLKGLSDNGSMWAQQILGARLMRQRPAEAIELFREAASQGSLQAIAGLANIYRSISTQTDQDLDTPSETLEQIYALKDSPNSPAVMAYAWGVVEEKLWRAPVSPRVELTNTQLETACNLAESLYEDLNGMRENRGQGQLTVKNPPFFLPTLLGQTGSACFDPDSQRDLSRCKGAYIKDPSNSQPIWFCVE